MKRKGFILIPLAVLFLPLFLSTFHEQNSGSEFQISAPLKNNHSSASHFRGRIQTLAIDEIDKSTGKLRCRFVHYLSTEDGKRYQIEDKKGVLRGVKPSWKMSIQGNLVENKVIVEDAKPLDVPAESEQLQDTIGEQRTLVALLNSPDDLSQPFTIKDVEDEIINNPNSTDKFFRENSYEKVWLNADFIDWQTLPHNSTDYSDNSFSLFDDTIDTLDPIVNFQDYERLIFIYTDTDRGFSCGLATLGKGTLSSSGDGDFTASITYISEECMNSNKISHEFGHNLGFYHASSVASAGPYFIPENLLDLLSSFSAEYEEYGDRDDNMGGFNSYGSYGLGHFSTIWKSQAQWIDATQIQEADTSGEYIIDQVEISSTGIKALKIPVGKDVNGQDFHYWLEYRKNLGSFDSTDEVNIVQLRTKSTSAYVRYRTDDTIGFRDMTDDTFRFKEQQNIINYTPKQVSVLSDITAISGGKEHSLALKSDGTVWAWGYNGWGQLGDGTTTDRRTPVQVSGLSDIIAIAGGGSHSLALKSDGTVWAWGDNLYYQLGDGTQTDSSTPIQVKSLRGVIAISSRSEYSLALKTDGTVWAWGDNEYGQLGDGTTKNRSAPVQVSGLSDIIAIAGGGEHSLALKSDGTVWAWGHNGWGQLGDGTDTNRSTPLQVRGISGIAAISGGLWHSLALKPDGTAWAWGNNGYGQLGDGTTENKNIPVQVSELSNIIAIACGGSHSLALKLDGTVWKWGMIRVLVRGINTTTDGTTPIQVNNLSDITVISGGRQHSLALKSDGTVWAWGTYELSLNKSQQYTDIDINKLFRDPYRGVRIKLIEKSGDGAESEAKLGVALSGLNTDPQSILDFGDVRVNSKSSKTVTVTNNSGGDIEFGSVSLGGRNPEFFTIVNDECSNKTLSNGGSCSITITFVADSEGDKFATLYIPNNDSIRHEATISLYGYGSTEITSTPTPMVTPTPTPTQKPTVVPTPVSCDDGYEPNDSNEKAYGPLISGSNYEAKICSSSDVDWYKLNITSTGTISLSLTGPSSNDFDLELYDSSDTLIASSNSGAGADESIHYDITTTGDYYIKVYEFYGSHNSTTPYTLAYSFTNCEIESVGVFPGTVKLKRESSKEVTVTVTGTDDCPVEGTTVTAKITVGKDRISISPISQATDEDRKATFKVTAGNTSGRARITFVAGNKEKILTVKIK